MTVRHRKPYRDRVAIVAKVLEMAGNGVQRTGLLYKAGMSSQMLDRYLAFMMNAKLLDMELMNGKVVLRATDRGKEFLRYCQGLAELLETGSDEKHEPYGEWGFIKNHKQRLVLMR